MIICKNCGISFEISKIGSFCSHSCYENWSKNNKEPNCNCVICNKPMYLKLSRIKRAKNGISCSKECLSKLKTIYFKGTNNHQFGLIGNKNSSFKNNEILSNYGYILEYCEGHPKPHDKSSKTHRVFQHRLIIERNYQLFSFNFFEEINGWIVLKDDVIVHHINENKIDNRLENLQPMYKSEHTIIHNKQKEIIRDDKGKIIGVFKLP